jgi:thioredoxin 1
MTNNADRKNDDAACGCGSGSCCSGPGKWIWITLALAVAGLLIAKNVAKKDVSPDVPTVSQVMTIPRLVDLGAGKCIPCKMMAPILEDLKKTLVGKLDVQFIDVWENPEAGKKYEVNVIPTQIFYDAQGKELFRHEGFYGKDDILAKWKELGVDLNKNSESRSQNPE